VATDTPEETIKQQALEDPRIMKFTEGKAVKKVIYVKDKLVNIVV
jgi:leucyl-tRNA synthetase